MGEQEVEVEEFAFDYEGQEIEVSTLITDLPPQWKTVRIEEIATELGSGLTPRGGEKSYQQNGIPLIRSQNVLMNQLSLEDVAYISPQTHQSMARSSVAPGDVLLNITGASIGRVAVVPQFLKTANVNQHVCRIRVHSHAYPEFVAYFLSSPSGQSQILGSQFGTTRQGLNYGNVRALRLPLPSLTEQRAIVHILHTVQETIQARRREADLERERKAAMMQHLFTYSTRGEATKQTELGEMPESWLVVKIEEIASDVGSGVTPRGGEKTYLSNGIPLIRSQNVLMNRLELGDVAFISPEIHQTMIRSAVAPGDVLLNITGASIGRVAVVPDFLKIANVNQHVCKIRLRQHAHSQFVSYFLSSPRGQIQILGSQFGTTRQGLNYGNVRALKVPMPNISEQKDIADALSGCDAKIIAIHHENALLDELFRSLLEELMTGRLSALPLVAAEVAYE